MPCTPSPKPPVPSPPAGITLAPPAAPKPPSVGGSPCCNLPVFTLPPLPLPMPFGVINPAFIATLQQGLAAVEAYLASLPLECPRS